MKKQNLTDKKELGEFCDQFAYDTKIQYPYKTKKSYHKKPSTPYCKYYKKSKHIPSTSHQRKFYSPNRKSTTKKPTSKKDVKCYKCGATGHYANRCRLKLKHKINEMSLDPIIAQQLLQTLSEEERDNSSESDGLADLYSSSTSSEVPKIPEPNCSCSTI